MLDGMASAPMAIFFCYIAVCILLLLYNANLCVVVLVRKLKQDAFSRTFYNASKVSICNMRSNKVTSLIVFAARPMSTNNVTLVGTYIVYSQSSYIFCVRSFSFIL